MKRTSIQNILVPIDFSRMSIDAIETAKRLAQKLGATIHLVHVRQFAYPATFMTEQLKTIAKKAGLSLGAQISERAPPHFMKSPKSCRKFMPI
jgi:nucleotide-binding universal stress UspA family protein